MKSICNCVEGQKIANDGSSDQKKTNSYGKSWQTFNFDQSQNTANSYAQSQRKT